MNNYKSLFRFIFFAIIFANLAITVLIWWQGSNSLLVNQSGWFIALGRLFGLLAQLTILMQLILIGRIGFVERLFGHDTMNRFHRLIGYSIMGFFLPHPILLVLGYSKINEVSLITQYFNFVLNWEDVILASFGLFIYAIIIAISLPAFRRKLRYESWYFTHLLIYVAILLSFNHQTNFADISFGGALKYWYALNFLIFGIFLLYRWMRPLFNFYQQRFSVEKIVKETKDVTSVYITGKNLQKFKYEAGQFAHLTFLQKGLWFTHPFSFSTATNPNHIRFSIKASGDFTKKVDQLKTGTKVIIDGPLGAFTSNQAKTNKLLLIAGGIGITPIRSIIEEQTKNNKNIILLYANKTQQDIAFKQELENFSINKVVNVLSEETSLPGSEFELGRIDEEKIKRLVPDYKERDAYICGPEPMMKAIVSSLISLGVPKKQIHFERFGY
jgi:predicted ferric reductase